MLRNHSHELDYFALVAASRRLSPSADAAAVRIALLSDAATQQFVPLLKVLFSFHGVQAEVYEGPIGGVELEVYDAASALYAFRPDVILLLPSTQALTGEFYRRQQPAAFLDHAVARMERIVDAIRERCSALVLLSNLAAPHERHFGNYEHKLPHTLASVVANLNRSVDAIAQSRGGVLVNDVESIASWFGRRNWYDDRLWRHSKTFCALEILPYVAQNIVDIALAHRGRFVKCVVLDLDNTLWGGVVGDDGVEGIVLSEHGDGEPFYSFQQFLAELKRRGILLAVCSKNEHAAAIAPFREHPEMVLRENDVAAFVANWGNKADNIKAIQEALHIGLDSMVFLDDNPFERSLVRGKLPEVIVPELPEDPADYVKHLAALNLFEVASFSDEDAQRADMIRAEMRTEELKAGFSSVDDFLASLEMQLTIARFDRPHLSRISQLIQRSNQFNLTTNRYHESDCQRMMEDLDGCLPLYARLSDRIADHGLISVVILREEAEALHITDWLMSCRVLARGVESALMNFVLEEAARRNCTIVRGKHRKTAKNAMVANFFARFGFEWTGGDPESVSEWALPVSAYRKIAAHMTISLRGLHESTGDTRTAVASVPPGV